MLNEISYKNMIGVVLIPDINGFVKDGSSWRLQKSWFWN